jgi:hypothetical protein
MGQRTVLTRKMTDQEISGFDGKQLAKVAEGNGRVGFESEVTELVRRSGLGALAETDRSHTSVDGDRHSRRERDSLDHVKVLKEQVSFGRAGQRPDRVGDAQLNRSHQRIRGYLRRDA